MSVYHRASAPGEEHGVHYYFITKDEFKTNIENHAMLEYAEYCDNFTARRKRRLKSGLRKARCRARD